MKKVRLIPNWRRAWRMLSVQAQTAALAVIGGWQAMPDDMRSVIPSGVIFSLAMGLLVAGIVGRLIDQPSTKAPQ